MLETRRTSKPRLHKLPSNASKCEAATTLFPTIIRNIGLTIGVLRNAPGYAGQIGVLGFYNPQALPGPDSDPLQKILNEVFDEAAASAKGRNVRSRGVEFASPFGRSSTRQSASKKANRRKQNLQKARKKCNPTHRRSSTRNQGIEERRNVRVIPAKATFTRPPTGYEKLGKLIASEALSNPLG